MLIRDYSRQVNISLTSRLLAIYAPLPPLQLVAAPMLRSRWQTVSSDRRVRRMA